MNLQHISLLKKTNKKKEHSKYMKYARLFCEKIQFNIFLLFINEFKIYHSQIFKDTHTHIDAHIHLFLDIRLMGNLKEKSISQLSKLPKTLTLVDVKMQCLLPGQIGVWI